MRQGNCWNEKAANPIVAAFCGALVASVLGYGLSYLLGHFEFGVISAHRAWTSPRAFMLAGLNLYAAQHVKLLGSGVLPDIGRIHANITFPLTVWAAIPGFALMMGGLVAARMRPSCGRWGMIGPAILGGLIYVVVLLALVDVVSAKFVSAALPSIQGTEFNPPNIAFKPSLISTLTHGLLFAIVFTYVGALSVVRRVEGLRIRGKWWASIKAVVIVGLIIQLFFAGAAWAWFYWSGAETRSEQAKFAQLLPTAAGMAYTLVHGAKLSYAAVPTIMPSQAYSADIKLYKGITTRNAGETKHKAPGRYIWIAGLIVALAAFASGRLAVRFGSRDGSVPTAFRVVIMQCAYIAVVMWLCAMGWGIAGQFTVFARSFYDGPMLPVGAGVLVAAFMGAHFSNGRYPTV